jgi:hypothetical protein
MALPFLTASRSKFRKEVERYFDRWARDRFEKCITSICAQEFYEYVLTAMAAGKDFSPDISELTDIPAEQAQGVVKGLYDKAIASIEEYWALPATLQKVLDSKITQKQTADSAIPTFHIRYSGVDDLKGLEVRIDTWRRNVNVTYRGTEAQIKALSKHLLMARLAG